MSKLKPYTTYYPVQYEYVSQLPEGWYLKKIKFLCDMQKGNATKITSIVQEDGFYPYLALEYLRGNEEDFYYINDGVLITDGIPLIIWDGSNAGETVLSKKGFLASTLVALNTKSSITNKYLFYSLKGFEKLLKSNTYGTTIPHVQGSFFRNLKLPVPPIETQNAIVEYLDGKTAQIQEFIAKKERLIELLEEQKSSIIRNHVTKGINHNTQLKPTYIDWIGDIPVDWEVKRLKYVAEIIYGISPHESTYNDRGIGTVLINGPVEYSEEEFGYTRALKWTTDPKKFAPKHSLLFCLRGSTTGRLNICHDDVSIGRGVAAIISSTNQNFLTYSIKALVDFISDSFKGSTFPSVTSEDLNNYLIPIPSTIEEQNTIVLKIEKEVEIIEKANSKAKLEIEKAKEYQESLITQVVTGQLQVPMSELGLEGLKENRIIKSSSSGQEVLKSSNPQILKSSNPKNPNPDNI